MILDGPSSPAVIIMLTQTVEANREKCIQYFPLDLTVPTMTITDPDDPSFALSVTLQSLREDAPSKSIVRELLIRTLDGTRSKTVYHLLFAAWPDFLVPEGDDRAALLQLLKLSRKLAAPAEGNNSATGKLEEPERVVHCSAGVGRSGTFIALDWLVDELVAGALDAPQEVNNDEKSEVDGDPVAEVVNQLRKQRMMMVQGEMQFAFIYEVLKELWLERWKARNGVGGEIT
jgi:protein-tyrosine phosphatase